MTEYTKPELPEPFWRATVHTDGRTAFWDRQSIPYLDTATSCDAVYTDDQVQAHADACVSAATDALRAELAECNERRSETIAMCEQLKAELAHIRAEHGRPAAIGQDSRILHELAGAASLCWEPKPTGVFDTSKAIRFVESALAELRASAAPAKTEQGEPVAWQYKHVDRGASRLQIRREALLQSAPPLHRPTSTAASFGRSRSSGASRW
jgi:hypothetical protein